MMALFQPPLSAFFSRSTSTAPSKVAVGWLSTEDPGSLASIDSHLIEGDGSAWESCCGPEIRNMTENVIATKTRAMKTAKAHDHAREREQVGMTEKPKP